MNPDVLTKEIKNVDDGYLRLAMAVFAQALHDAFDRSVPIRSSARRWLRGEGKLWMSAINMDDVYNYISRLPSFVSAFQEEMEKK